VKSEIVLTTLGAARILHCSVERVRQLDSEGKLKSIRTTGGRFRLFDRKEVERLAEARKRPKCVVARQAESVAGVKRAAQR
jgi:excisionase family DNA binding protein